MIEEHIKKHRLQITLEVASIIIVSLIMLTSGRAPPYFIASTDITMGLLFFIAHLIIEIIERTETVSKEEIIYCENGDTYHAQIQNLSGKQIIAYHPSQNVQHLEKCDRETLNNITRIYNDIRAQRIEKYVWFVEVAEKDQMEAIISRLYYLKEKYDDLIKDGKIPIWIHECSDDRGKIFPYHFQWVDTKNVSESCHLALGKTSIRTIDYGVVIKKDGAIWRIFDDACKFVREKFEKEGVVIIDDQGNIYEDQVEKLCQKYGITTRR